MKLRRFVGIFYGFTLEQHRFQLKGSASEIFNQDALYMRQKLGMAVYKRSRILSVLCVLGLLTPMVVRIPYAEGGVLVWLLDMVAHWQWLYAAGLLICAGFSGHYSRRWLLLLPLAGLPFFTASQAAPATVTASYSNVGLSMRIVSANVHYGNVDPSQLSSWLTTVNPDVIVLIEVSPGFAQRLNLIAGYPFRVVVPRDDPFGMAVLSRLPLVSNELIETPGTTPMLRLGFDLQGKTVLVTAFHPMPPISKEDQENRNLSLWRETEFLKRSGHAGIIAGDFNATPWSNAFAGIDQSIQRSCGLAPTWPALFGGWMGIPIDQVLITHHWRSQGCQVGSDIGSDHLPVMTRLVLSK